MHPPLAPRRHRCRWQMLALAALTLGLTSIAAPRPASAATLTIFGDSYSVTTWPFATWPTLLVADQAVIAVRDFAVSGATAASIGTNTLAVQLGSWVASATAYGPDDVTLVYLGYNDIGHLPNLDRSKVDLEAGLSQLIARGAMTDGHRLLLVIPHDWGRSPPFVAHGNSAKYRARTLAWRSFLQAEAIRHPGIILVDLFAAFEPVFSTPANYGFTNITRPAPRKAGTTALYYDSYHFGAHGQLLIEQVIKDALGRKAG